MNKQYEKAKTNGWDRHEEHVLAELKRIGYAVQNLDDSLKAHMKEEDSTVSNLRLDVARLETKITTWGAAIAAAATLAQPLISKGLELFVK